MDDITKAFANPVRIQLLCCLSRGKKNVNELITVCGLSQSAVSQHLQRLRKVGLVKDEKNGKHVYYSLVHMNAGKIAKQLQAFTKEVRK